MTRRLLRRSEHPLRNLAGKPGRKPVRSEAALQIALRVSSLSHLCPAQKD